MSAADREEHYRLGNFLTWVCANLRRLVSGDDGVTAIEYGLIAMLIVVTAAGAIALMGGGVDGMWTLIAARLTAAL